LTTLFAWRYFKSKKTTNAINLISYISMVAVAVVTAALVVVLSVFNGFEQLVQNLYADFYTDIKITATNGKWLTTSPAMLQQITGTKGVAAVEPVIQERAMLMQGEDKSIVWLKGVEPGYANVSGVPRHLLRGQFALGNEETPALVMGSGVENGLQVIAGQNIAPVTIYLPNRRATLDADPLTALHTANAFTAGTFSIQQEFDNQYAFTNAAFMRYMLDLPPNEVTALEIAATPGTDVEHLTDQLQEHLGKSFTVQTRYQQNQALFAAMKIEKLIIMAVAFLILLIAAFNIISSLTMMVLEKEKDIAVLQAMGATGTSVAGIFLKLGALLAGVGGFIGGLLGVLICIGQQQFHWVKLGGQSFIIDYYPVEMRATDFLLVGVIIFTIAIIAGFAPSRRALRIQQSLR